jgi:hypothetical protein
MINKKLSDLFLRKDKPKEEPKAMPEFDESFFHCRLLGKGVNTDLIRIQTELKESRWSLTQPASPLTRSSASGTSRTPRISRKSRTSTQPTTSPASKM